MTRNTGITKRILQLGLAAWAIGIPLLEIPSTTPDYGLEANPPIVEVRHTTQASAETCATACVTPPPDFCGKTSSDECDERSRQECPVQRNCCRCLTTGDHLVFVNPGFLDFEVADNDPMIPPSNQAAPVNLFQPPVPPPKSA